MSAQTNMRVTQAIDWLNQVLGAADELRDFDFQVALGLGEMPRRNRSLLVRFWERKGELYWPPNADMITVSLELELYDWSTTEEDLVNLVDEVISRANAVKAKQVAA